MIPVWVHPSEKLDRSPTHTDNVPEIHLKQCPGICVGCAFDFGHHDVPGIVEHDVEAPKDVSSASKCDGNVIGQSDIKRTEKKLGRRIKRGKTGGTAEVRSVATTMSPFRRTTSVSAFLGPDDAPATVP